MSRTRMFVAGLLLLGLLSVGDVLGPVAQPAAGLGIEISIRFSVRLGSSSALRGLIVNVVLLLLIVAGMMVLVLG